MYKNQSELLLAWRLERRLLGTDHRGPSLRTTQSASTGSGNRSLVVLSATTLHDQRAKMSTPKKGAGRSADTI